MRWRKRNLLLTGVADLQSYKKHDLKVPKGDNNDGRTKTKVCRCLYASSYLRCRLCHGSGHVSCVASRGWLRGLGSRLNKRRAWRLLPVNIHVFLNCTQHTPHCALWKMASASTSRDTDVEAQRDVLQPHRTSHPLALCLECTDWLRNKCLEKTRFMIRQSIRPKWLGTLVKCTQLSPSFKL